MRARIRPQDKLTLDTKAAIKEVVAKEAEQVWMRTHFVAVAMFALALNETYGFGVQRLHTVLEKYTGLLADFNDDLELTNDVAIDRILTALESRNIAAKDILPTNLAVPHEFM